MKMTKKLFIGAAVAMAAVMFTGCMPTLGVDFIDWNDAFSGETKALSTATIDYTNESSTEWARGMKLSMTGRGTFTANIIVKNQSTARNDGVMGIAFDVVEHTENVPVLNEETGETEEEKVKMYDFMLLGVQNVNGVTKNYVTHYYNIREDEFNTQNFGAIKRDSDGNPIPNDNGKTPYTAYQTTYNADNHTTPYEIVDGDHYKTTPSAISVNLVDAEDETSGPKELRVAVKVEATEEGGYKVIFYGNDAVWHDGDVQGTVVETYTFTPEECNADLKRDESGYEKINRKLGCYANVYCEQTLAGEWQIWDIAGNPITDFYTPEACANPIF